MVLTFAVLAVQMAFGQQTRPRLLQPGFVSDLPQIEANDNRNPAGTVRGGVLELDLEVVWADMRVETESGPGLRVAALGEGGKSPSVPGPLIRVQTGTTVRARVRNALGDSTITVFGLQSRPATDVDSLFVKPGGNGEVTFEAGEPGTYYYWVRLGVGVDREFGEREQLAGALIIDPEGGSPPDRIFVINIFSTPTDTADVSLQALTINGYSWPFTERQRPSVGDTLRWRVINASNRNHPMHLHGFYYDVTSRGTLLQDTVYEPDDRRKVVTEMMLRGSTMAMEWVPSRPGNWLFHCHLSFHVSPEVRLPGAEEADDKHHDVHMAGLVVGIEVQPGPSDLIEHGEPKHVTLYANEYADGTNRYGFSFEAGLPPDSVHGARPGPPLILKQYQTTFVTVKNQMSIPTGIHWHGLELDSWADGVPGWSSSDGRVSPVIRPGGEFTYKLSLMRPGTFVYHSHLNDVDQLSGGLYGALLVFGVDDNYDPATDHIAIVGWKSTDPKSAEDVDLNGWAEPPVQQAVVDETHRIRLINIAPAGRVSLQMLKGEKPVLLTAVAKDGADLPKHQRVGVETSPRLGVGETADYTFTPTEPGIYELVVGYPSHQWRQRWEVVDGTHRFRLF